jgi:DNA-binding transcriptional MerR regulator
VRVSELSAATGVTVPTIKFYLREGLLPAGRTRAANQADYDEAHLRRLRLIRALVDVGGMRLRDVRAVLTAIDDERVTVHDLLGITQDALVAGDDRGDAPDAAGAAQAEVDQTIARLGWQVHEGAATRRALAEVVSTLQSLGWSVGVDELVRYGRAVDELADWEVATVPESAASRTEIVEHVVVGTVLFERVLDTMRLLAQEHHSARRFAAPDGSN